MRKIIAVLVVFALVAGAAFAETSISGNISVRAKVYQGIIGGDDDVIPGTTMPTSLGGVEAVYVQLSGENDEGTFGGVVRLRNDGLKQAYVYWRPIPQLEVFFGQDPDGKFAFYNPWSHFNGQEGYQHPNANWRDWRKALAFNNFETFGIALTLRPIPGLEVNLVIPTGETTNMDDLEALEEKPINDLWGGALSLSASFAIPDIGTVWLGLKGPGFPTDENSSSTPVFNNIFKDDPLNYGIIGLGFSLSAVEGLDLMIGGSTIIPGKDEDQPVYLMLMANYAAGDFGVKTRWRLSLNGDDGYKHGPGALSPNSYQYVKDRTTFGVDILPYYNLGILTAYLNIGIESTKVGSGDPVTGLVINPYIRMGLGAGSIRIGVIYQDPNIDKDDDTLNWNGEAYTTRATVQVPITFGFSF